MSGESGKEPSVGIFDGDIFAFQAAAANEVAMQWDAWLWTRHSHLDKAIAQFDSMVTQIARDLEVDRVVMALSHHENFRKTVYPEYKFNRKASVKPVCYSALRDYVQEQYETFVKPGLEGDDVLGILLTHPHLLPEKHRICVSLDKDMQTLPGWHLNDGKAREAREGDDFSYANHVRHVTVEDADRYHMLQTLAGDTTDGYPGVPGIGMVNAERLLDAGKVLVKTERTITRGARKGEVEEKWVPGDDGTPWEIVLSAYRSKGLGEAVATQMAQIARICRYTDYDYKKQEVKLWQPPSP